MNMSEKYPLPPVSKQVLEKEIFSTSPSENQTNAMLEKYSITDDCLIDIANEPDSKIFKTVEELKADLLSDDE